MSHRVRAISVILLALGAGACTGDDKLVEVKGACADVFGAPVCTWAKTKGKNLVEAGAVVPLASIENAPADQPMVWPPAAAAQIDMPEPARQQGSLTHLSVYWEPGGHPPAAFMTPHFDFHFYTVPDSERAAMDCKDLTKPASRPVEYSLPDIPLPPEMAQMMGVPALIGLCVPEMGMHALPVSEIERKEAFSGTMVIGYYKGEPIFIEPMLSKAMLLRKDSFALTIPHVPGLVGSQATQFRGDYDATQQAYRFTLSAFTRAS
jgi:hypothetical protein